MGSWPVIQACTLFNSEMAPAHLRGALNILFQLSVTIGILAAQLINYGAQSCAVSTLAGPAGHQLYSTIMQNSSILNLVCRDPLPCPD